MSETPDRSLDLRLTCGCLAALARRKSDERFVLHRFDRADSCGTHAAPPAIATPVQGFGPYPDWGANVMLRVQSVPEAGGMMEREHAFILDGQFVFFEETAGPRPVGPIRDAAWAQAAGSRH